MTTRKAFQEQERRALLLANLGDAYAKVARHLNDGRPALAEDLCREIIEQTDSLGDAFTTTQYPSCLACGGTAEMPSPSESDRKVRCQDTPSVCVGNRFGRMHPVQMQDFMVRAATPKPPEASLAPPKVPDETIGDLKPTPAPGQVPPYVYDRDAVIAYNDKLMAEGLPELPIPDGDEELLAHADGTFTVRKISAGQ